MAEQAQIIRWESPPRARGNPDASGTPSRFEAVAAQLRAQPGTWAVIEEKPGGSGGLASHILGGAIACFRPSGDFDACSRRRGGITTVYARYVGGDHA